MSVSSTEVSALDVGEHLRIVEGLRLALGGAFLDHVTERGDLWVRVDRTAWRTTMETAKSKLGLTYFGFLSGIDWAPAPGLSGEKTFQGEESDDAEAPVTEAPVTEAPVLRTGVAGGATRFQVLARLHDVRRHVGINLKTDIDENDPSVDSICDIFRGADWHERETWEMFGFNFVGHPGLRHLYLPGEFEGYPLRKDFPLLAREVKPWPGLVNVEQIPDHLDPKKQAAAEAALTDEAPSTEVAGPE